MESCGSSGSHEFVHVKEEPAEYLPPPGAARGPGGSTCSHSCYWHSNYVTDHTSPVIEDPVEAAQVKVEAQNDHHSDGLTEEECANDTDCVNEVKEELSCSDSLDCGVSEAAMLAGLYTDHEVKDELVLGLECPHKPDVNLVVRKSIRDKRLRNCCIRLERLPSYDEHQTTTQDTTKHTDSESNEEEIGRRVDCKKESICDLCGECFALKSDLVKHAMQHIYMPTTKGESGHDVADYASPGQCKQEPAQERALCRKYALQDCCVQLERLHSDALLAGNQRRTPALHTTTHADSESDTELKTHNNVNCDKDPTCDICGLSFALKTDLKKHVIIHIHTPTAHDQSPAATIHSDRISDTEEEIDISVDSEKDPVCDFCGAKFALYSNLMKHVMIHSFGTCSKRPPDIGEINMYVCDTCGKAFKQKFYLISHIQNTHPQFIPRPYRRKHFTNKNYLAKQQAHTNEKLYSCNICQKLFTVSSRLIRHTRIHTGEKPYSCEVCNRSFAQKEHLKAHVRMHTGEKPYSCTICSMRFPQKSNLVKHKLTHIEEQPFSCTICNKRFKSLNYLKKHTQSNTHRKKAVLFNM